MTAAPDAPHATARAFERQQRFRTYAALSLFVDRLRKYGPGHVYTERSRRALDTHAAGWGEALNQLEHERET